MQIWRKLFFLFRRGQFDRDLEEEIRFHLEMKAQAGGGNEEAHYTAQRKFGNTLALREASREMWGWGTIDRLWQDLRYGLRILIAVLTLAVGIGVNTAIFTAFNAVALRPLDVPEPERVVQIDRTTQAGFFAYPDYEYFRDNSRVFSGLTATSFFAFSMTGAPALRSTGQGGIAGAAGFSFPEGSPGITWSRWWACWFPATTFKCWGSRPFWAVDSFRERMTSPALSRYFCSATISGSGDLGEIRTWWEGRS